MGALLQLASPGMLLWITVASPWTFVVATSRSVSCVRATSGSTEPDTDVERKSTRLRCVRVASDSTDPDTDVHCRLRYVSCVKAARGCTDPDTDVAPRSRCVSCVSAAKASTEPLTDVRLRYVFLAPTHENMARKPVEVTEESLVNLTVALLPVMVVLGGTAVP